MKKTTISLVAIPEAMMSTLSGLYDVFTGFDRLGGLNPTLPATSPFDVEIVAPSPDPGTTASGLAVTPHRSIDQVSTTDIIIIPSLLVESGEWVPGRYPAVVDWLKQMHAAGAIVGSTCSGVLLLAETGLLDGRDATLHWAYIETFKRNFPRTRVRIEEVLIAEGDRQEIVMSGASASWGDLALYLIARAVGPTAAQALAGFMLLQWHTEGQAPYVPFAPRTAHGDAAILKAQTWLAANFATTAPLATMVRESGLTERTFKRRFAAATGHTPIDYVQRVRIEAARRLLERTDIPTEKVAYEVGYMEPAAFRRIFRRITHLTPVEYRRRFRAPYLKAGIAP